MTDVAEYESHVADPDVGSIEDVVRRFYDLFDAGRLDDYIDSVHPDFTANVLGTTELDWAGFRRFGQAFSSAFPDGIHRFEFVIPDKDSVVTIGTYEGTHLGEMQGIEPTARVIQLTVMHLDRVIDGKLIEHRGLANEVDLMRQLGIEAAPWPERPPRAGLRCPDAGEHRPR